MPGRWYPVEMLPIVCRLGKHRPTLYWLALAIALAAPAARASLLYQFSYTSPTPTLNSFSFSLASPTFITSGSPAFTPFTVTDGTTSWTMTQDLVVQANGFSCFEFGTAYGATLLGCGASV